MSESELCLLGDHGVFPLDVPLVPFDFVEARVRGGITAAQVQAVRRANIRRLKLYHLSVKKAVSTNLKFEHAVIVTTASLASECFLERSKVAILN